MTRPLSRDSLLERAPAITLRVHSSGNMTATVDGRSCGLGIHALAVLAGCVEPVAFGELADRINVTGGRDFVDVMATVLDMLHFGVLRAPGTAPRVVDTGGQWTDPAVHVSMLRDGGRTSAFMKAIAEHVKPGDVVLDIGTGTGVLAIAAAHAGARRVFAIEASAMADIAMTMCEKNNVTDRVEVLRGWSSRLKLAELADVLVTETLGNDPLEEHAIDILIDAKKRLLKPGAKVIPARVRLYAMLVEIPGSILNRHAFTRPNVSNWAADFGIDFEALLQAGERGAFRTSIPVDESAALVELSEPVELGCVEFAEPAILPERRMTLRASRPGRFQGVLVFFEVQLTDSIRLTTRPSAAEPDNHWMPSLWIQPRELLVTEGDCFDVMFRPDADRAFLEVVTAMPTRPNPSSE